jgi:hypothetical protein
MSAWDEIGPIKLSTVKPESCTRDEFVAAWIKRGFHCESFTKTELESAVNAGLVIRSAAANHAAKFMTWQDAYEIRWQKAYIYPPADVVRENWKTIGYRWLTRAERLLHESTRRKFAEPNRL